MVREMNEQTQLLELKKQMATRTSETSLDQGALKRKIKEAQEICKILGLKRRFRLMMVEQFDSWRSSNLSNNNKLEAQIQVQDEGGALMIWTEEQFDDKLAMMRDGLQMLEQQQAHEEKSYSINKFKTEIFESDISMQDEAQFDNDLMNALV